MVIRKAYVVARGISGRPLCMHRLLSGPGFMTVCGVDMSIYSRSYASEPLDAILCKKCARL